MTFREKWLRDHPALEWMASRIQYYRCPADYGYEEQEPQECCSYAGCDKCWDRQMPEKEEKTLSEIKDSGARREFSTGAVRDAAEGRGRCDLLPLDVVADLYAGTYPAGILSYIDCFIRGGDELDLLSALKKFCTWHNWTLEEMLLEVSVHFEQGAKKYAERNWELGIPLHCYIDSAVRHFLKAARGDTDERHDRAFCWNLLCALWTLKHKPELDDLPHGVKAAEDRGQDYG